MELKIVFTLVVAAISVCYCSYLEDFNGEEWEKIYTKAELERYLTEKVAPDAKEVGRILAKADFKFQPLDGSKGIEIVDLLSFTLPYYYCRIKNFDKYEEWRRLLSEPDGNVYLMNYVKENTERLFNTCANNIDEAVKVAVRDERPPYSRQMTNFARTKGKEEDPQEKIVEDYLAKEELDEEQEQMLIEGCAEFEQHVKKTLFFFLKDDKQVTDHLDNLGDFPDALVYKRCMIIKQMFAKQ